MRARNRTWIGPRLRARAALAALALLVLAGACARQPGAPEQEPEEGLWSKLTEKATEAVSETPRILIQKAIEETERLLEKVNEDYAPVLREAGFEISQVRISLGVPPALAFRVKRLETLSEAQQEEILERHDDDEALSAILQALFAMSRFDAEGYELHEIMIYSDLPPRVTLILTPMLEDSGGSTAK